MKPTELQLKTALFKMLREHIVLKETLADKEYHCWLQWKYGLYGHPDDVLDTELLHLCHMAEDTLDEKQWIDYLFNLLENNSGMSIAFKIFCNTVHSSWQERVIALAKTKGIELK